jgi:hypothetical protein
MYTFRACVWLLCDPDMWSTTVLLSAIVVATLIARIDSHGSVGHPGPVGPSGRPTLAQQRYAERKRKLELFADFYGIPKEKFELVWDRENDAAVQLVQNIAWVNDTKGILRPVPHKDDGPYDVLKDHVNDEGMLLAAALQTIQYLVTEVRKIKNPDYALYVDTVSGATPRDRVENEGDKDTSGPPLVQLHEYRPPCYNLYSMSNLCYV